MTRRIMAWFAQFIANRVFEQLLSAGAASYLGGLAYDAKTGEEMAFSSLPTIFWPILATLVLLISGYHGLVKPARQRVQERRRQKYDLLRRTYWTVKHAINPEILDETNLDRQNPHKLFAISQSTALNFIPECRDIGWCPDAEPPPYIQDEETLGEWEKYLIKLRESESRRRYAKKSRNIGDLNSE